MAYQFERFRAEEAGYFSRVGNFFPKDFSSFKSSNIDSDFNLKLAERHKRISTGEKKLFKRET